MSAERAVSVVNVPARSRYEVRDGAGELVGRADYHLERRHLVIRHVEVDPDRQSHGLGGWLVQHVLDDVRARGLQVVPRCPFARRWLRSHPGYADLVDRERAGAASRG